jgi:RNA polymerase sigma-70 factor (ECF subfamily)
LVELSDEVLCERVAARDERAFDLLVERYQERAYRVAWAILRNGDDARDVSQDAFIRLYEIAGTFAGRARFSTWFYRIVVNLSLDHRRRHRWWRSLFDHRNHHEPGAAIDRHPEPGPSPADDAERKETLMRLRAAAERLSPQQRAAITLQIEGLSTVEMAEVLGCSPATVRVHLHRAIGTLRTTMGEG